MERTRAESGGRSAGRGEERLDDTGHVASSSPFQFFSRIVPSLMPVLSKASGFSPYKATYSTSFDVIPPHSQLNRVGVRRPHRAGAASPDGAGESVYGEVALAIS